MTDFADTWRASEGEVRRLPTSREIAQRYLERVKTLSAAPQVAANLTAVLDLFTEDVEWDIPGDREIATWIGERRGHEGVAAFFHELAALLKPERFAVRTIVADDETAVILGDLASIVRATGRLIESPFAIELTIRDGRIARYLLLEDSHAVARAAT